MKDYIDGRDGLKQQTHRQKEIRIVKNFPKLSSPAIIPLNCNLLQSVVYQKPFRAIEGNFSLGNLVSENEY